MQTHWATDELRGLKLGDRRRVKRAERLLQALADDPQGSIPQACASGAATKAAYRFLSNEAVEAGAIRQAHQERTLARARALEEVWVVQDTTALDFTAHASTQGLGVLDSAFARGLKVHSALALVPGRGTPLGVVHQQVWARGAKVAPRRKRHREAKESHKWAETIEACERSFDPQVRLWIIGDRESDVFHVFCAPQRSTTDVLVRAAQDRRIRSSESRYLWEALERQPLGGTWAVELERTPTRPQRRARLEVRWGRVVLEPPEKDRQARQHGPVAVWAVLAREVQAPAGVAALEWLLLSTRRVESLEEARTALEAYGQRWKVERYHYVLKSGCRIEGLQLEHAERIERALALYSLVAWRLLWLTYQARATPRVPCTAALSEAEWKTLYLQTHRKRPPPEPPTLQEATRWIARLGGFLGRKQDAEPGVKVLWRGLRRLQDLTAGFLLAQDVGNG